MDSKLRFKAFSQSSLFPEDIFSRIDKNHPVRLVNRIVDELDYSPVEQVCIDSDSLKKKNSQRSMLV